MGLFCSLPFYSHCLSCTQQGVAQIRYTNEKEILLKIANGECQMTAVKASLKSNPSDGDITICNVVAAYKSNNDPGKLLFQIITKAMKKNVNHWALDIKSADARALASFLGLKGWKEIFVPGYLVTQTYGSGAKKTSHKHHDVKMCFKEDNLATNTKHALMPTWIGHSVFCATDYPSPAGPGAPQCVAPFLMDSDVHPDLQPFMKRGKSDVLHASYHNFDIDPEVIKSDEGNVYKAPRCIAPLYAKCDAIDEESMFTP